MKRSGMVRSGRPVHARHANAGGTNAAGWKRGAGGVRSRGSGRLNHRQKWRLTSAEN